MKHFISEWIHSELTQLQTVSTVLLIEGNHLKPVQIMHKYYYIIKAYYDNTDNLLPCNEPQLTVSLLKIVLNSIKAPVYSFSLLLFIINRFMN